MMAGVPWCNPSPCVRSVTASQLCVTAPFVLPWYHYDVEQSDIRISSHVFTATTLHPLPTHTCYIHIPSSVFSFTYVSELPFLHLLLLLLLVEKRVIHSENTANVTCGRTHRHSQRQRSRRRHRGRRRSRAAAMMMAVTAVVVPASVGLRVIPVRASPSRKSAIAWRLMLSAPR